MEFRPLSSVEAVVRAKFYYDTNGIEKFYFTSKLKENSKSISHKEMAKEKLLGPAFIQYMKPIVDSLQELGGSGNSGEVLDMVIEKMEIPEAELEATTKTGVPRVKNRIHWARMYLVKAGLIDPTQHGVWTLTEDGLKAKIENRQDAYSFFKKARSLFDEEKAAKKEMEQVNESEDEVSPESPYQERLLEILQGLPPEGFERICQRLLRMSGFKKVMVTGKSGDGGID